MELTFEEIVEKVQQMYPEQFGRVVAELRAEKAEAEIDETRRLLEKANARIAELEDPEG